MSHRISASLQVQRAIHRGLRTLGREGRLVSSLLTIGGFWLLLGLLLLTFLGLQTGGSVLRSNASLKLELERTATPEQTQSLFQVLREMDGVSAAKLTTKDETLTALRERDPSLVSFIDTFGLRNPFPDTITLTLQSIAVESDVINLLKAPTWQGVVAPEFLTRAQSQQEQMHEVLSVTETGAQATAVILTVTAVTLLLALIALLHRRILQRGGDTQTQVLLGASPSDIFLPLWTETTILLLGGLLFSAAALEGLIQALPYLLPSALESEFLQSVSTSLLPTMMELGPLVLGGAVVACPLIAALAALSTLISQSRFGFFHRSHA